MSEYEIYLDENDVARLSAGYTVVRLAVPSGPEVEIFPPDTPEGDDDREDRE